MGLGKTPRAGNKDLKAYSLKIKTKDLPKPHFEVAERQGDKFVTLPEPTDAVTGTLIAVEPRENLWQGKTIKSVNATITDADNIYFLTIPYSGVGRSLMNSLLSLKEFTDIEISLYQSKPKTEGAKTYPSVSLRQAGDIVRWKYDNKDLPAPKEIVFKGEKIRDFEEVEKFLASQLTELNKVVKEAAAKNVTSASVPTPSDTDSVPF